VTAARVNPYRPNVACTATTAGLNLKVSVVAQLANPNCSPRVAYDTLVCAEKIPWASESRTDAPVIPCSKPVAEAPHEPVIAPMLSPELTLADIELRVIVSRANASLNGSAVIESVMPPNVAGNGPDCDRAAYSSRCPTADPRY